MSRTTSASARIGSRRRRSSSIAAWVLRPFASGCRWRVSENRRMRTSSLASRKKTCGRMPRPSSAPRIASIRRLGVAGAHVEDDRRPGEPLRVLHDQLGEIRQELAGQVVDDRVREVLEQLRRRRLAAARQAAQQDDVRPGASPPSGVATSSAIGGVRIRYRPVRRMNQIVPSNSRYSVMPSTIGLTRSPPGVSDRREDRDDQDDASPARPAEPLRRHDPDPRQADEQDRELHEDAEGQEQRRHEVEVAPDVDRRLDALPEELRAGTARRTAGRCTRSRRRGRRTPARAGSTAGRRRRSDRASGPGAMNRQRCHSITGIARMIPTTSEIWSRIAKPSPISMLDQRDVGRQRRRRNVDDLVAEREPDRRRRRRSRGSTR